jgi:hypothetical protein
MFCTRGSLRMCWNAGMPRCPLGRRVSTCVMSAAELNSVFITDPRRRGSWRMGEEGQEQRKESFTHSPMFSCLSRLELNSVLESFRCMPRK